MRHPFIEAVAETFADAGTGTFRYNYPYSERGRGLDGEKVRLATVRAAVHEGSEAAPDLPLFVGGHSMSGRMTLRANVHQPHDNVRGIMFLGFPLYQGKPSTTRAEHLADVTVPMLFVSGDRDALPTSNTYGPS